MKINNVLFLALLTYQISCQKIPQTGVGKTQNSNTVDSIKDINTDYSKVISIDTVHFNEDLKGLAFYDSSLGHLIIPEIYLNEEYSKENDSLSFNMAKIDSPLHFNIGGFVSYDGKLIGNNIFRKGPGTFIINNPLKIYQQSCMNIFENDDGSGGVGISEIFPDTIFSEWKLLQENDNHSFQILDSLQMEFPTISGELQNEIDMFKAKRGKEGHYRNYFQELSTVILRLEYGEKIKYLVFSFQYGG